MITAEPPEALTTRGNPGAEYPQRHSDVLLEPAVLWHERVLAFPMSGSQVYTKRGSHVLGSTLQWVASIAIARLGDTYLAKISVLNIL
jgi:hypothetical protein